MIEIDKTIFFKQLTLLPFIQAIILYGSRARDDARSRSDIDLAIKCSPNTTDRDWHQVLSILDNADTLLQIDCVRYELLSNNNPLKKAIDRDGIILFKKQHHE